AARCAAVSNAVGSLCDVEWMRGYPGNDHALDRLREIVGSGQASAFVGAGASAGLYPLWGELIGLLIGEAVERGDATGDDRAYWLRNATSSPQQVVPGIKKRLGGRVYSALLEDVFRQRTGPDGNTLTPVHRALLILPFRAMSRPTTTRGYWRPVGSAAHRPQRPGTAPGRTRTRCTRG
ncbi:MAG: hypothetical protein ACRDYA_23730, partial [Egibacteraceae bacterium]